MPGWRTTLSIRKGETTGDRSRCATLTSSAFSLVFAQSEDYEMAQVKKEKMELYRADTYKQLQTLNLLDIVMVGGETSVCDPLASLVLLLLLLLVISFLVLHRRVVKERNF